MNNRVIQHAAVLLRISVFTSPKPPRSHPRGVDALSIGVPPNLSAAMQSTSRSYENVFEELVDSLNRTSASIEDALNRLKTAYDARLQLDQFTAQARHRLFCELRLYGENVYPVTLDFITRTKTAFDTLSHVENISQLKAILPHIVPDCEELLLIENSLSNKYGKILENMQNIKESLSINMAGTLSASL